MFAKGTCVVVALISALHCNPGTLDFSKGECARVADSMELVILNTTRKNTDLR